MEIVENTLETDLESVLERPLFCYLAQAVDAGPRLSPLWFLWEDGACWIIARTDRSYLERADRQPEAAVAIVDFDRRTGRVEHVGMRGRAAVEPYDPDRAQRLLTKYLGNEVEDWPDGFVDLRPDDYRLIRFDPETVVARDQSYPAPPVVWNDGD
ncbi:pyridoxamine 5'-phosphate oxidase family protein [Halopiger aswanensis]|uniref:Pyridoxamine 5'-phosphate oxidase N-terminal domain-containing protein n=1 Tax=Halopiger aswanensis TaxID=148449 RepID=A0A419WRS7_9EURY|nr:pyridoxamine 5'-phosphate oxidase family protein [Halopiger aswanensis]RKD98116.1 hypothetical protein ATJ93_1120 [Halopiger aswanensis]